MTPWRWLVAIPALLSLFVACSKVTPFIASNPEDAVMAASIEPQVPAVVTDSAAELASRLADIKAMIGVAAADYSAQCKVVGVGQKPCGGPAFYLPYSTKEVDEAQLLARIDAYNQLAKAHNQRSGMMSDCAIVPVPQVALVGGFCKIGAGADAL